MRNLKSRIRLGLLISCTAGMLFSCTMGSGKSTSSYDYSNIFSFSEKSSSLSSNVSSSNSIISSQESSSLSPLTSSVDYSSDKSVYSSSNSLYDTSSESVYSSVASSSLSSQLSSEEHPSSSEVFSSSFSSSSQAFSSSSSSSSQIISSSSSSPSIYSSGSSSWEMSSSSSSCEPVYEQLKLVGIPSNSNYSTSSTNKKIVVTYDQEFTTSSVSNLQNSEFGQYFHFKDKTISEISNSSLSVRSIDKKSFVIYLPATFTFEEGDIFKIDEFYYNNFIIPSSEFVFLENHFKVRSNSNIKFTSIYLNNENNSKLVLKFNTMINHSITYSLIDYGVLFDITVNGVENCSLINNIYVDDANKSRLVIEYGNIKSANHMGFLLPTLHINAGTDIYGCSLPEITLELINDKWEVASGSQITTLPSLSLIKQTSYGLEATNNILVKKYFNINSLNIEFGTIFIDKEKFDISGCTTISSFMNKSTTLTSYYKKITSSSASLVKDSDSEFGEIYKYTSFYSIPATNYDKEYIACGYTKIDNTYTYNEDPSIYASVNSLASLNPEKYRDIVTQYFTVTLNSTDTTYELVNDSFKPNIITMSYYNNGYYKVVANSDIDFFNYDGNLISKSFNKNDEFYIQGYNGTLNFKENAPDFKLGTSEPNKETWYDTNSNLSLNSYTNNAIISEALNSKAARIWVNTTYLIASNWRGSGLLLETYGGKWNTTMMFAEDYTNELKNTIKAYRDSGVEEITLYLSSFAHSYRDRKFFIKDTAAGEAYNTFVTYQDWAAHYSKMSFSLANVFEDKNNTQYYDNFMTTNRDLYTLLANTFDFDCVESMNEINLSPHSFCQEYYTSGEYLADIGSTKGTTLSETRQKYYREQAAEFAMDYCKIMTEGIRASNNKNIKVLTPAIACVGDYPGSQYMNLTIRDGLTFIEKCYQYLDNINANSKDYFQAINLHPYVALQWSDTRNDSYIYKVNDQKEFNDNYVQDWTGLLNDIHQVAADYGDPYVPFIATEFGFTDYAGMTGAWKTFGESSPVIYNAINDLISAARNVLHFQTLLYFRLYSFADSTNNSWGEGNFGFITIDKTVKRWGNAIYYQFTGKDDYTNFANIVSSLESNDSTGSVPWNKN